MAKLIAKKDAKDKRKNVKIDHVPGEKKGDFLQRLVKQYSGVNATLPKVF